MLVDAFPHCTQIFMIPGKVRYVEKYEERIVGGLGLDCKRSVSGLRTDYGWNDRGVVGSEVDCEWIVSGF